MSLFRAALAAAVLCLCAQAPGDAASFVSLNDAFRRVIDTHPDLAAYRLSEAVLDADRQRAAQTPPVTLETDVENVLGSGGASDFRAAELTLSLRSVIERGDKRVARGLVAERHREGVDLLRDGRRLDLLAEVARRYLDALAADQLSRLIRDDLAQREALSAAAIGRRRAGAESESLALAADAARLRVAAELERSERAGSHARQRLAMSWGDVDTDLVLVNADLGKLPALPDQRRLLKLLDETPALQRFAHTSRLREARVQLARASRIADLDWKVGLRRLGADDDWALVASVSVPFGSARRAEPGIRAAEAELAAVEFERESQQRVLAATLIEAWSQLDLALAHATQLSDTLLPALGAAADAAARSYRAGAASYLEWAHLQGELIAARRERLDAALTAHRALIELQRLTGQSFALAETSENGDLP